MENKLINHFFKITDLSPEELNTLKDSMFIKTYKKDSFLLKEGQLKDDTFFVMNGLIRQYKIVNGEEITTNLFSEEQWIISLNGFTKNKPADHFLICAEETTVVVGNEEKAQELFKKHPRLETVSRMVMEKVFEENQRFMTSFITNTPEQRYLKLLETRPDIFQRVPQYHIATYLGIKPESLSRIRKRITGK